MKKLIAITLILTFCLIQGALALPGESICEAAEKGAVDIPIKQLRAAPLEDSNVVFDIPVRVELLEISSDGNWFKVLVSYGVGPFQYTYVGWTKIPVAEILAERGKEPAKIAKLTKEK